MYNGGRTSAIGPDGQAGTLNGGMPMADRGRNRGEERYALSNPYTCDKGHSFPAHTPVNWCVSRRLTRRGPEVRCKSCKPGNKNGRRITIGEDDVYLVNEDEDEDE